MIRQFTINANAECFDASLDYLELDTRSRHRLMEHGYKTIREIIDNIAEIPKVKGIGGESTNNIIRQIYRYAESEGGLIER